MNKKIVKILSHLMQRINTSDLDESDLQMITDTLMDQGFTEDEIMAAIAWLSDTDDDEPVQEFEFDLPRPVWRQLNEMEQEVISPHAFSYLFHLREMNILGDAEMERIIDRALRLDLDQIGVEDMQDLIAVVLLDFEKNASNGYFQFTSSHSPH